MTSKFKNTPLPKYYSASRELRNQAEKQRRDKLNHYVGELAALVPFVVSAQRKVDKTSVLRLAASYIRLHQILDNEQPEASSMHKSLAKIDASRTLMNAVGGFLLVLSSSGQVIYVSEAIEDTFGYTQADVLGQSFFQLIHQEDRSLMEQKLSFQENTRLSFYCRMLEKTSRSEPAKYEIIHIVGQLKKLPKATISTASTASSSSSPSTSKGHSLRPRRRTVSGRRSLDTEDEETEASPPEVSSEVCREMDTHMLVAFVEVVRDRPITELSWVESLRDEYITRHRIDGSIEYVDHRISFVAGFMPAEVVGHLAFNYMHRPDMAWSLLAQRQMFLSPEGQGTITYRLMCKDGSHVSLRSRGFLEVNKSTGKVDSFVCINTVLSAIEAEKEVRKQRQLIRLSVRSQSPEEIVQSILAEIPPNLFAIAKELLRAETLRVMLAEEPDVDSDGTLSDPVGLTLLASESSQSEPIHDPVSPSGYPTHKRKKHSVPIVPQLTGPKKSRQDRSDVYGFGPSTTDGFEDFNLSLSSPESDGHTHDITSYLSQPNTLLEGPPQYVPETTSTIDMDQVDPPIGSPYMGSSTSSRNFDYQMLETHIQSNALPTSSYLDLSGEHYANTRVSVTKNVLFGSGLTQYPTLRNPFENRINSFSMPFS